MLQDYSNLEKQLDSKLQKQNQKVIETQQSQKDQASSIQVCNSNLQDLIDRVELLSSEQKQTRTKHDGEIEELSTEIYNQKRELSKYKPTSDLQAYIDEKVKRLDNRVSLSEQDLQRTKLEVSNMNVEFQERYNSLAKRSEDLERDILNAFELLKRLEDF